MPIAGDKVNRTYGGHNNLYVYLQYFYQQYLILVTMVPRNSVLACFNHGNLQQKILSRLKERDVLT